MIYSSSVYEDEISHQVMLKIYDLFSDHILEHRAIYCHGKGKIKKQIGAYNNAAQQGFYFVLVDLDNDYECAASLIKAWLPNQCSDQLVFRIAVHEIESWLLADKKNFAAFFSISQEIIPLSPDSEPDPKQTVISLAKKSRRREIRETIVPIDAYASIGPGYNAQFRKFIQNFWDVNTARKNSPSLDKAILSLEKILCSVKTVK